MGRISGNYWWWTDDRHFTEADQYNTHDENKVIMLSSFFYTCITAVSSTFAGIFVNVFFNDFGIIPAIIFYACVFFTDYHSTVRVRNFTKHETNPLFCIFSKRLSSGMSFGIIFAIGIGINIISYAVLADPIISYVLGMCHLCAAANNYHISKKIILTDNVS